MSSDKGTFISQESSGVSRVILSGVAATISLAFYSHDFEFIELCSDISMTCFHGNEVRLYFEDYF
mgnify:CR=1 FL=1